MKERVARGNSHTITCNSRSVVHWFYSKSANNSSPFLQHGNKNFLSIYDVQEGDAGFYWCHGRDVDTGRYFLAKSQLQVLCKS